MKTVLTGNAKGMLTRLARFSTKLNLTPYSLLVTACITFFDNDHAYTCIEHLAGALPNGVKPLWFDAYAAVDVKLMDNVLVDDANDVKISQRIVNKFISKQMLAHAGTLSVLTTRLRCILKISNCCFFVVFSKRTRN